MPNTVHFVGLYWGLGVHLIVIQWDYLESYLQKCRLNKQLSLGKMCQNSLSIRS